MMPEYTKAYLEGYCNGESAIKQKIKERIEELEQEQKETNDFYFTQGIIKELYEILEE